MFKGRIKATGEIANFNTFKAKNGETMVQKDGSLSFFRPEEVENIAQFGWHPASELPEKPTSKLGRVVILTLDGKLNFNYYVDGWDMSNVKWWCYPPKLK